MNKYVLSNSAARRVFLDRHALHEMPQGEARGQSLLDLIDRLGFVQLDSINTVARAHDLILFSRRPAYRPKALKSLYEKDRGLFEHWTHDAATIPMRFYPTTSTTRFCPLPTTTLQTKEPNWGRPCACIPVQKPSASVCALAKSEAKRCPKPS